MKSNFFIIFSLIIFEFINFNNNENNIKNNNNYELLFAIIMQNVECLYSLFLIYFKYIFSHYYSVTNNNEDNKNKKLTPYENSNKSSRKYKYAKLLQIKNNRKREIPKKDDKKF